MKPEIVVGMEVYNCGDRANQEHFATITDIETGRFGTIVTLQEVDDPAHEYKINDYQIGDVCSGNGSTRIVTKAAYLARRSEQLALMKAAMSA